MAGETLKSPFLHKRGVTTKVNAYSGPQGEIVVDTEKETVVVQTGSAGGSPLAKATTAVIAGHGVSVSGGTLANDITIGLAAVPQVTSGTYGPSSNQTIVSSGAVTVPEVTTDGYGRVTGLNNRTVQFDIPVASALQPASSSILGGVMVSGGGLVINSSGLLSIDSSYAPTSDIPDFGDVGGVQQPVYFSSGVPVAGSAPLYTVPQASENILGGVKISGGGVSLDANGVISVTSSPTADKLNTVSAGGAQQPVYFSSGVPVAGSAPLYSVPQASDSILGGVKISGGGLSLSQDGVLSVSGGSTVSVAQVVTSGTKIATITVDATPTDIYAPLGEGGSSNVVGTPVISGNDYCVAEHDYEFSFYTYTALNNVTIDHFVIDGGSLGTANVTAISNSGQYSFTIPSNAVTGSTYTISIYAVDSLGNQGDTATKTITVNTVYITTPKFEYLWATTHISFEVATAYYVSSTRSSVSDPITVHLTEQAQLSGAEDTLEYYEFKICSDSAGNQILLTKTVSSFNVNSNKYIGYANELNVTEDTVIYVFGRAKYLNYGYSNWVGPLVYKIIVAHEKPSVTLTTSADISGILVAANIPTKTVVQPILYLLNNYLLRTLIYSVLAWNKADIIICSANTPNNNIVAEARNQSPTLVDTRVDALTAAQVATLPTNQTLYCFARVSTNNGSTWSAWSEPALLQIVPAVVNGYQVVNANDNDYISKANGRILPLKKRSDFGSPTTYTVTAVNGTLKNAATDTTLQTYALDSAPTNVSIASNDISSIAVGNNVKFDLVTTYTQDSTTKTVSNSYLYTVTNNIVTPSGRTLYRHSSNQGSVLSLNVFGVAVLLLILDAAYRKSLKWGTYNVTTPLKKFSTNTSDTTGLYVGPPYVGTEYIYSDFTSDAVSNAIYVEGATSGTSVSGYNVLAPVTDAQLQSRFAPLQQDLLARANCDVWMTYQGVQDYYSTPITGVPSVEYARSLSVSGVTGGFDIPNLFELLAIYVEGDYIDALDPTLAEYPAMALGKFSNIYRWFNGSWAWASSEYSASYQRNVSTSGYAGYNNKYYSGVAVPVCELQA